MDVLEEVAQLRLQLRADAEGGDPRAQYMAAIFAQGMGVRDDVDAARLFGLAAAQGYADAQSRLGSMYHEGRGVAQDSAEAARLWRLAAAQGDATSVGELTKLAGERAYVSVCCAGCGATRKLKTCARCKVARFCGPECVKMAWAEHKPHCARWAAEAGAGAS